MSCFLSHSTELSFYFSARRERIAAGGGALPRHCRQDLPFFPQNSGFPHLVVPGPELLNHGSRTPGAVCSSNGKRLFLELLAQAGCFFPFMLWCGVESVVQEVSRFPVPASGWAWVLSQCLLDRDSAASCAPGPPSHPLDAISVTCYSRGRC